MPSNPTSAQLVCSTIEIESFVCVKRTVSFLVPLNSEKRYKIWKFSASPHTYTHEETTKGSWSRHISTDKVEKIKIFVSTYCKVTKHYKRIILKMTTCILASFVHFQLIKQYLIDFIWVEILYSTWMNIIRFWFPRLWRILQFNFITIYLDTLLTELCNHSYIWLL